MNDTPRPNFVVIFCDDLGYGDLGCYGSKVHATPNIDRMAEEGIRLTQFYTPSPACTPSRASLLTGRYPLRTGLPRVVGPFSHNGLNRDEVTIARVLREQGYATGHVGKWHLGHWVSHLPTRFGFDEYIGVPYSHDMDILERHEPPTPLLRGETVIEQPVDKDTLTQRYAAEAVEFIRAHKDEPFFLYLAHNSPHVPLHVSDAFRGRSAGGLYGDVVEEIDDTVGQVLRALEECGLDDRTLVIFSSDHGPWLIKGDQAGSAGILREGKATVYEGGVRVPCVARWPGVLPAGREVTEPMINLDIAPTMARLAGSAMPEDRPIDGEDVFAAWTGEGGRSAHRFQFEWRGQRAMRAEQWKFHMPRTDNLRAYAAELYDLEADPGETCNLAARHPDLVRAFTEETEAFYEDMPEYPPPWSPTT